MQTGLVTNRTDTSRPVMLAYLDCAHCGRQGYTADELAALRDAGGMPLRCLYCGGVLAHVYDAPTDGAGTEDEVDATRLP